MPGDMQIRVYKRWFFFSRLVGWVDAEGNTYKRQGLRGSKLLDWTVDKEGRIYLEYKDLRGRVGWVDGKGNVYDRVLLNYRTHLHPAAGYFPLSLIRPGSLPGLTGRVSTDGRAYKRGLYFDRLAGHVVGTNDLRQIAGLALLLIFN